MRQRGTKLVVEGRKSVVIKLSVFFQEVQSARELLLSCRSLCFCFFFAMRPLRRGMEATSVGARARLGPGVARIGGDSGRKNNDKLDREY
jgi:hypothetical protein